MKKYFVFWDHDSKRGWLVNGTSTLLHLVRANIEVAQTDNLSPWCLFDKKSLASNDSHNPNSAISVLMDENNLMLPIYAEPTSMSDETEEKWDNQRPGVKVKAQQSGKTKFKRDFITFGSLVKRKLKVLEQLIEYQKLAAGQTGVKIKAHLRKYLEGWDFVGLAEDCDTSVRVATLNALGYGWVDLYALLVLSY
jgi:hypothetical protein